MAFQSCIVYNATLKVDSVCDLHNEKMEKAIVKTWFGTPASWGDENSIKYKNAKKKKHMGCVRTWRNNKKYAKIYHCATCDKIKKEYLD